MKLTGRERIWRVIRHKPVDRPPCVDVYFLPETLKRWEREGYPDGASPEDVFDLDLICLPIDCTMGWREELMDETDEYIIRRDADGVVRRHWKIYTTAPQELEFPIKEARDWRNIRPALKAHESRLPEGMEEKIAQAKGRDRFVTLGFIEPCTLARRLLGSRQWVTALQTTPPMLDEILETAVRLIVEMTSLVLKRLQGKGGLDGIWLKADLAYTHGAFMTDRDYRRVVLPYHRQLVQELKGKGLAVFLYTPGKVETFLKGVRKSGFDALLPLETFSRNDLAAYKQAYGRHIALGGNISVDRLMESDEAAEQEIRKKVTIGLGERKTGYLFCLDRPVPPMVPFSRYRHAIRLVQGGGG